MAFILNIDTAVETASLCLSAGDKPIGYAINENRNDQAAWLHQAIHQLVQQQGISLNQLEAVAVSIGPGSYTGLRLGLSAAKGLCYALNIPLITIGTLKMMAYAVIEEAPALICPLIDARRMEVFTAVYDQSFSEMMKPVAMVINEKSFHDILSFNHITFCGNAIKKLQTVLSHDNATFSSTVATAAHLPFFANKYFWEKKFTALAYSEPLYIKEFYTVSH